MLFRKTLFWTLFLICLTVTGNAGFAQSTSATFGGTILDQNGAAISSVTITMLNRATGLERRMVTNEDGSFSFPLIPPGNYVMTVQREGFSTVKVPDLVLNINDLRSVRIQLKVGSITGTIDIIPAASLMQTSTTPGVVIDRQFIADLPLNGRTAYPLVTLAPGVVLTGVNQQFGFSSAGQRPTANYLTVDGVSANIGSNVSVFGRPLTASVPLTGIVSDTKSLVSDDSMQELRVQTSNYGAEFGRTPGAQVQIFTRAGGNKFSGSLFEYLRNDVLDAQDYFTFSFTGFKGNQLRYNDFGGVVGGPIVKDRTFFFVSYEGLRAVQPSIGSMPVPSMEIRRSAPPQVKPLLDAFPLPNAGDFPGLGLSSFFYTSSNPSRSDGTSVRVDHRLNQSLSIFGRYSYAPSDIEQRNLLLSASLNRLVLNTQTMTVGAIWLINSKISNELLANFSRFNITNSDVADDFGGAVHLPDSLMFPAPFSSKNALFDLQIYGIGGIIHGNAGSQAQRQVNVIDNLSLAANNHQLRLGVDYRHLYSHTGGSEYQQSIQVGGFSDDPPFSHTLLAGLANDVKISSFDPLTQFSNNLSLYAQDTWKVSPRLTFSYGLRWELNPSPMVRSGENSITDLLSPASPGFSFGAGQGLSYKTTYGNFAPRLAIALQLSQASGRELVLRAGFGTFYDQINAGERNTYSFRRQKELFDVPIPLSPADAAPVPSNVPVNASSSVLAPDTNLKLPRTYEWNISLEQSLGKNQVLSATYVGAAGRRLLNQDDPLKSAVVAGSIFLDKVINGSSSDYNALQLQYQRRLSGGIQVLASYTLAHSIDNASSDFAPVSLRGPSDFDVRHTFTSAINYSLPTVTSNRFAGSLLKDWSFDLISRTRSALPVDVSGTVELFTGGQVSTVVVRPDLIPGVPLYLSDPTIPGGRRINRNAFTDIPDSIVTSIRQGNLGRNTMRGFPAWQFDFGIHRQFSITDRLHLQFGAEAFNFFNHPNFGNPQLIFFPGVENSFGVTGSTLASSLGNSGTSGGLNTLSQFGGPRSIQFALKFLF